MNLWLRNFILLALMLAAAGLALALRPIHKIADQRPAIELEAMIPHTFGEWREEPQSLAQIVDPQQKEMIDKIYEQTLARAYVNAKGQRIMLSVAYGSQQDKQSQVHRPEVCYPAQGFAIRSEGKEQFTTPYANIPVQRLVATQGGRIEPITYWIRVGDDLANGWVGQKIAVVKQKLHGQTTDGLLFRVSSLAGDSRLAYPLHDQFIIDLLGAMEPADRHFFVGRP